MEAARSHSSSSTAPASLVPNDDPDPAIAKYLFYRCNFPIEERTPLAARYRWTIWCPTSSDPWPREVKDLGTRAKFLFRSVVYFLGLFAGDECGALLILDGDRLAHYSQFSPRYWRFPGMRDDDLQIGDTWTDPADRGSGLASFALEKVIAATYKPGRNFWYVVGATNAPSIRVVEKAGFALIGQGSWVRPFGIKLLGSYVMQETAAPPPAIIVHP